MYDQQRFIEVVLEAINAQVVSLGDSFQGFLIFTSISGGVGAGVGPQILKGLSSLEKPRVVFGVIPSLEAAFPSDHVFGESEEKREEGSSGGVTFNMAQAGSTIQSSQTSSTTGAGVKFIVSSIPVSNPALYGTTG